MMQQASLFSPFLISRMSFKIIAHYVHISSYTSNAPHHPYLFTSDFYLPRSRTLVLCLCVQCHPCAYLSLSRLSQRKTAAETGLRPQPTVVCQYPLCYYLYSLVFVDVSLYVMEICSFALSLFWRI